MKRLSVRLVLGAIAVWCVLTAQTPGGSAVVRLDPALDEIIAPDAKAELLKGDYFGFLEGPVWVQEGAAGYLLFSDTAANAIYKW
jgi:gluconolactonase